VGASADNVGVAGQHRLSQWSRPAAVAATVLAYTDTTVALATNYSYTLDAFDGAATTAPCSAAAVTTRASRTRHRPASVWASAANGTGTVSLS
jgi:hypothetical protein